MTTFKEIGKQLIFLFHLALVIYVATSCGGEASSDAKEFKLEKIDYKDWEKLLNVESVVQLQESDSCLMSFAQKCIFTDNCIIFSDNKVKKIYAFSYDGKFLRQIGCRGHSASEYMDIADICMSKNDSTLIVFDRRGMVCYDPDNGKFVERKKFHSQDYGEYNSIMPVGDSDFICYTDNRNNYSFVLDSPNGQRGLRKSKRYHFGVEYFYKYDGNIRVISDFGDFYIDNYEDGKLKTLYKINLGLEALPDDVLPKTYEEIDAVLNSPEYFKFIGGACETSDWLYLEPCGLKLKNYIAFINKHNGKYAFGREYPDLGLGIMGAQDNYFYALIYPEYAEQGSLGRKILEKHNITKNSPVVVKLKLNENILQ